MSQTLAYPANVTIEAARAVKSRGENRTYSLLKDCARVVNVQMAVMKSRKEDL